MIKRSHILKVIALFLVLIIHSRGTVARNDAMCNRLVSNGWFKQYKYKGSDGYDVSTRTTRQDGSFKVLSEYSTEAPMSSVDPGTTTNRTWASTQSLSSFGECSFLTYKKVKAERERYVAQNKEELKKETALGRGEHLAVLAYYSLCDESSLADFSQVLQKNFSNIFRSSDQNTSTLVKNIDKAISSSPKLRGSCQIIL